MKKTILFIILIISSFIVDAQWVGLKDTQTCVKQKITIDTLICNKYQVETIRQASAHYMNNVKSWLYSDVAQDAVINWLIGNKDNKMYTYGLDDEITNKNNWKWIARFNKQCLLHGIYSGFVWSNSISVTKYFNDFQIAQTDGQCLFKMVQNEGEPYNNTISYTAWWKFGRDVREYVNKWNKNNPTKKILSGVYVGWHTAQSTDSIVVLYDYESIHCYIPSSRMGQAGGEFGYTSTRIEMGANSCVKMKVDSLMFEVIFSDENIFSYSYYVANKGDWGAPFPIYVTGFNLLASALAKQKMRPIGYVTFVYSESKKIKPVVGLPISMLRAIEPRHIRKRVTADADGNAVVIEQEFKIEQ